MIPWVDKEKISKLDELMVKYYKVPIVMMMELAGYRLAEFVRMKYPIAKKILILVGKGNNGGDGLSSVRHLLNFGFSPKVFLIDKKLKNEAKKHLDIVKKLKVSRVETIKELKTEIKKTDLIVDCLIGYNLKGEPKGKFRKAINLANKSKKPILSCDIPSGIDANWGAFYETFIQPDSILFLSLPKKGCKNLNAEKYVADIGVPKELYKKIKLKKINYFKDQSIVKLS